MYVVEFLLKEQSRSFRKFLKKNRVETGKQVSVSIAEELIQTYQGQSKRKRKEHVVLVLQDFQNEKAYEFELPIKMNESFSLLKAIEKDLEEHGDSSLATEINEELFNTYKEEQRQMARNLPIEPMNDMETKFSNDSHSSSDFEEMNEAEMNGIQTASFDESQISDFEKETQELFANTEEETQQMESSEEARGGVEGNTLDEIEKELGLHESPQGEVSEEIVHMNDEIVFPSFSEYLDLSESESKKDRYASRFSSNHLLKLLGVSEENVASELEKRKLQYAKQMINSSEFLLIEDEYYHELKNMSDETRLYLQNEYHQTMLKNYSKEAERELEAVFEEQDVELMTKYSSYEEKEKNELEQKLESFREKQRLDLAEFKSGQETALQEYRNELEQRKSNLLNTKAETLEKEKEQVQKQVIQDKIYKLKLVAQKELIDKKNQALVHYVDTIESLMNKAYQTQQRELKRIQEAIHDKTPSWLEEIKHACETELNRKEHKLEEQRLALEERKLNESMGKNTDKEIIRVLQEQLKAREEQLQQFYCNGLQQQNMITAPMYHQLQQPVQQQPVYQQPQSTQGYQQPTEQPRKGFRKWLFG